MHSLKNRHDKVNLACGSVFVDSDDWLNLDFAPESAAVRKADLLKPLALEDGSVGLVYSSHFLEHVPFSQVPDLLSEALRVLRPGGVIRLVLPDLENLAREYLSRRQHGDHAFADFVVLELIDQSVRRQSGGQLGNLLSQIAKGTVPGDSPLAVFVRHRVGHRPTPASAQITNSVGLCWQLGRRLMGGLSALWIRIILSLLPSAFRAQNVSLAALGELHHWLWDFHQLRAILEQVGFSQVQRQSMNTSLMANFPFDPLDIAEDGEARKGDSSMYVEAIKPMNSSDVS